MWRKWNPRIRNVRGKFEVDHLSRFRTWVRQVFSTQKPFSIEISITMITTISNYFNKHIF